MKKTIATAAIALGMFLTPVFAANTAGTDAPEGLMQKVRHELVMLPYYGVFDHFQFRIEGDRVTLLGDVSRPTLKSSAERVVKQIEGVGEVDNQIKVLPVSPFDDRIRVALYRTLYGNGNLSRYSLRAVPTIHIIVDHGNVTLEGAVGTEADKNIAFLLANQVPGVFQVTNNLIVDRS